MNALTSQLPFTTQTVSTATTSTRSLAMSELSLIPSGDNAITMTSREIAELADKRHDNVMTDIRKMLAELHGEGGVLTFQDTQVNPQNGQSYPIFKLPKRETLILVSGYSVAMRAKIIDRWQALEEQATKPAALNPANFSRMQLIELAMQAEQERIESEQKCLVLETKVKTLAPKVEAFDRIATADGMLNLQTAGKVLQQPPNKFIQKLREIHWIYKPAGCTSNRAHVEKINVGYLTTKAYETTLPDGTTRIRDQVLVTPKGLAKLALMLGQTPQLGGMA